MINGEKIRRPGAYYALMLHAGENTVSIQFDMQPRLREMEKAPIPLEREHIARRRFIQGNDIPDAIMTFDRRAALLYGPLLLTRSKKIGSTEEEMFHSPSVCAQGFHCHVTPVKDDRVRNAYRAVFAKEGEQIEMNLCDYATGTNEWSREDPLLFHIYL